MVKPKHGGVGGQKWVRLWLIVYSVCITDLLYLVVVEVEFLQPLYLMEGTGRDFLDGAARNIQGDDLGHLHVCVMEGKDTLIEKFGK